MDAVSSAIGPAIIETAKGIQATNVPGAVGAVAAAAAAIQTAGMSTARDRNNRRRRNGEMPVRDICTNNIGPNERQWGKQQQQQQQQQQRQQQRQQQMHDGQPPGGGRKYGVLSESLAAFSGTVVDGDGIGRGDENGADESSLGNGAAFAEARRKMLDPPKVTNLLCLGG